MHYLAEYYACQGNLLCFKNAYQGWKQIKRGFFYSYWYYRIKFQLYDEFLINNLQDDDDEDDEPICKEDIRHFREFIGTGMVLAPNETKFFLDEIENSVQSHILNWESDDCYVEYILHLYQKLNNRPLLSALPPAKKKWVHPYDKIFQHWNNETKLHDAILEMLDYHLKWNLGYTQDAAHHYSEFHSHFSMINPVEVHALEFVRNSLNLKTPVVNHQFLTPPFYPIPAGIKEISMEEILNEDPLLKEIVWRCDANMRQKYEQSEFSSFSSQKNNEDVHLLKETLPTKDILSTVESTPINNENIRVYLLSVEQLQKLFGSKNLSLLESFDFSSYHSNQVYTATKYLLEGIDNSPDISSAEYALAWETLCHHVGKKINIEDFQQVNVPARNAFESIMVPLEMAVGEKEVLGYMMKQFIIEEFLETINIESTDSTAPEQETALGLGILMHITNQIQNSDNQQTTTDNNQLQKDPDFINTSLGIASLLLLATKEKQDLMIFLSPTTVVDSKN
jgi:hypothetical protein